MVYFYYEWYLLCRCVNILRIFPKDASRVNEQGFAWKLLYFTLLKSTNLPESSLKEIVQVNEFSLILL